MTSLVIVQQSRIHHKGVFAKKLIPQGTRILEYKGRKITKKQADKLYESMNEGASQALTYLFDLNSKHDLDGNIKGNTAKYINHSCEPNCEAIHEGNQIFIEALKDISEGEELTYHYGFILDEYEEHPCRCNTPSCVGYIIDKEYWLTLQNK